MRVVSNSFVSLIDDICLNSIREYISAVGDMYEPDIIDFPTRGTALIQEMKLCIAFQPDEDEY